ncbi:MAG: hypothetical protein COA32_11590 [Fluviicola sp.]|nr:MAG: hypothetical protein COA32_11590 [Fluviicola sp.]
MINEIISTTLQILVIALIPFVVFLIKKKKARGFFSYIGFKRSNTKANLTAVGLSLVLFLPPLIMVLLNEEFREIMLDPQTTTGKFREMSFSISSLILILIKAVFETALAEEILFRGFTAKRLIAVTNYQIGNLLQAAIFGIIHCLLFMTISSNPIFLVFIGLFTTVGAYLMVFINEKMANGSILPGWIMHATANLMSYCFIGFLV